MARQLRPRKGRPNYVTMAGYVGDEGPLPPESPQAVEADDQGSSGSDFKADSDHDAQGENFDMDDEISSVELAEPDELLDNDSVSFTPDPEVKGKGKGKAKARPHKPFIERSKMASLPAASSLSRSSNRKMYVLPTPSVHHRHRAMPLFLRTGLTERLTSPPSLFKEPETTPTYNFTHNTSVTDRASKAWGYNVGAGPLWSMMEDRGWFKEEIRMGEDENDLVSEAKRRPRVWEDVKVQSGWQNLDVQCIFTTDEGRLQPPPAVICSFGPIENMKRTEMKAFEARKMSEFIPMSKSHVFNAGGPVWGIDWCPIHPIDRPHRMHTQYLAVAPYPSASHSHEVGKRVPRPYPACIQIWSLKPSRTSDSEAQAPTADSGEMKCEMVLCTDCGPALEVKWCPLPSHDLTSDQIRPRKLGLLAGTFEDGSMSVYAVPDPKDVTPSNHDTSNPVFIKMPQPLLRIELEETACLTLDWANSEMIAVGCSNGSIAIYNIGEILRAPSSPGSPTPNLYPTHYLSIHQSAIRALAWIRTPPWSGSGKPVTNENPTVIASGGYDGVECLWDIREMGGNVMNRTRDVIHAMSFSPFSGGPVTIDHDNTIKTYSASPSMLGRGHTLMEPGGPVWSLSSSDYHPQLAVGSADGSCSTTNMMRSTRRGGSVPFFVHKIYQLDYSRKSGEYRMLEQFFPQVRPSMYQANKSTKDDPATVPASSTGAWPSQVGVHRVAWNSANGLGGASLLASATAAGLCRVDWLEGRWLRDKVPYVSVANIRKEVVGDEGESSPAEDED